MKNVKKVLLLGSGAIQIGQAGEFDYSGSQAIKALKEENVEVIVINPNIATVQTSPGFANQTYFLPLEPYFVEEVIKKEKPDGILLSFGGQTALNCGVEMEKNGVFRKHGVKVLGTPVEAIEKTEDRQLFKEVLSSIGLKTPKSRAVSSVKEALEAAKEINYPIMVRGAFALGGKGSGYAENEKGLIELAEKALSNTNQILVEEYLWGWKEIEYEVVRDSFDNCITVCNMENFDPLGIHTGESIVIAPSQTLTNHEYHYLREISIKLIKHLGIVGECNVQFALDPKRLDYRIIEVNARLSRSSALASKATGYPLAFIAAKLALGHSLFDLKNAVTKKTSAFFEPALDYVVIKIPRWDLQKFRNVSTQIGSEMKSVGEVMAIGRTFEEAIQKAIRMLQIGMYGLVGNKVYFKRLTQELKYPTDKRIFAVVNSLIKGTKPEKISKLTGIDKWFIEKIQNVVRSGDEIRKHSLQTLPKELLLEAKRLGFSDKQISILLKEKSEFSVREKRKQLGITPFVRQVDTLAAEFPAKTNYLYMTYSAAKDDVDFTNKKKTMVLGSGAYRIGSSVEFDWCCVNAAKEAKKEGLETIMVNHNPETVSTDYDECDRLYFEELSLETVLDIFEKEKPQGIIVSMGGQTPNNLALKLHEQGATVLGTKPENIDKAEDRHKFSKLCDELGITQPEWKELSTEKDVFSFAKKAAYPVLVRPSYVLSGSSMSVAFNQKDLKNYLKKATSLSKEYPVVVSKFVLNAREIEIDAVANKGEIISSVICEHVENAGTHSGDATLVTPPQKTYIETLRQIKEIAKKLAKALEITGPFNIQFIAKDNEVKVIECNLRASRSFPFISKVTGNNFAHLAAKAILGQNPVSDRQGNLEIDVVGVKAPQFSFGRLKGADPISGVEMASTGEVGCIGSDFEDAFLKAVIATGMKLPKKNIIVSISGEENRYKVLEQVSNLSKKFDIYCTDDTYKFFSANGVKCNLVHKLDEKASPNIYSMLKEKKIDLVVSVPNPLVQINMDKNYDLRRATIDYNVSLITNLQVAKAFFDSILKRKVEELEIKSLEEYLGQD